MQRERLSSRLGFILLSAGCAIGLGNVWRFPYITGRYGGAAFVLIYLVFLALIGLPVMTMEFAIGRAGRMNISGSLRKLEPRGTKWHIAGPFAVAGNYILLMFYSVITGWLLYYCWLFASGRMPKGTDANATFGSLVSNPSLQILMMALALLITALAVIKGLRSGVEKITKVMMVMLILLLVGIAVHSCLLPGASDGLKFYLMPDFSALVEYGLSESIFAAMGQAFFSLSLGIGAMSIFGSYFDNDRSLTGESVRIIILDTAVALIAGLIIFPSCSAFGVDAGTGPSLLFISLSNVFSMMMGGRIWGTLFFVAMLFAALSTLIAVFENINSYWMDNRGWPRKKAVIMNAVLLFVLSIPCVLGFNVLSSVQPLGPGSGILDLEDFVVSNLILPLGSLTYVFFCTLKCGWGWKAFLAEADQGEGLKFPSWLRVYCTWILPIIILIVTINGIVGAIL